MKYLLIYHKEDNDGVFSGALFYDYLVNVMSVDKSDIRLFPADYNDLKKFAESHKNVDNLQKEYEHVVMTDISFTEDYMAKLHKVYANNMIWCDHHAPIIKASFPGRFSNFPGVRNTTKSAILCVWEFLYDALNVIYQETKPGEEHKLFPQILRLLSAWDSWSYEREGYSFDYISSFNIGINHLYQKDFDNVVEVIKKVRAAYYEANPRDKAAAYADLQIVINKAYEIGCIINDYESKKNANLVESCGDMTWEICINDKDKGHPLYRKCCAMFKQGGSSSAMFHSLKKTHPEINHGLVFKRNPDSTWTMSMYNVNEEDWFHCGEFLKENYNGGGHKGAAGCVISEETFIKMLKKKIV